MKRQMYLQSVLLVLIVQVSLSQGQTPQLCPLFLNEVVTPTHTAPPLPGFVTTDHYVISDETKQDFYVLELTSCDAEIDHSPNPSPYDTLLKELTFEHFTIETVYTRVIALHGHMCIRKSTLLTHCD